MLRLRLIVLLIAALVGGVGTPDVVHADTYKYDASPLSRVEHNVAVAVGGASPQVSSLSIGSLVRSPVTEGMSTTPYTRRNATEAVVIGEDMRGRVIPAASGLGAGYYDPPPAPSSEWMENNRRWINDRMDEGCVFYDCGPAPGRSNYPNATSEFYQMELTELAKRGYPVKKVGC